MQDYTDAAKLIARHTWPPLEQMPDGRWKRSFQIKLKEDTTGPATLAEFSSIITQDIIKYLEDDSRIWHLENDLVISLNSDSRREITADILTVGDGNWDEYMVAAWRMFEDIDRMLGPIATIEGQARDSWPPWSLQRWTSAERNDL